MVSVYIYNLIKIKIPEKSYPKSVLDFFFFVRASVNKL